MRCPKLGAATSFLAQVGPLGEELTLFTAAACPTHQKHDDLSWMAEVVDAEAVKPHQASNVIRVCSPSTGDAYLVIPGKDKKNYGELSSEGAKRLKNLTIETFFVNVVLPATCVP